MTESNPKNKKYIWVYFFVGIMVVAGVVAFIVSINWLMTDADKRGRESLEVFTEQTSHRLEDMLENNGNILHQLNYDLGDAESLRSADVQPLLLSYRENWDLGNVGFLLADDTAVGADGKAVALGKRIDPLDVDGYAYGVYIAGNTVDGQSVLSFALARTGKVDGRESVGLFITIPLARLDDLKADTVYGNDKSAFIAVIDTKGNTIWRSEAINVISGGANMFDDMQHATFEHAGELEKLKSRLALNLTGNVIYHYNGEKKALAYVPLKTNYWKMIIGMSYDAIIAQDANYLVSFIMIASITLVTIIGMGAVFYLIFRRRSAEFGKRKAESEAARAIGETKAKSEFLSRMSHELRTPLNGIVGMIELASRYGDDREKREEYLGKIKDSSAFLLALISDILDMSKIENGKLTLASAPFDLKKVFSSLEDMFAPLAAEKNLTLTVDYSGLKHDHYVGDEIRFKQIAVNLLSNAVKFTEQGSVTCVARDASLSGKHAVLFTVEDTGRGIGKDFVARVFEPFEQEDSTFTRSKEGAGLGLSISANLVKIAGGTITLDSGEGKGSKFTVTLPLEPAASGVEKPSVAQPVRLDGVNVLLAEDNPLNAEIAVALIADAGANVTAVVNGKEAYEKFVASACGDFDVILMDIQMPEMDGMQATRAIRESAHPQAQTVPIIAMTANALSEDREKALAAGMNDHLSKPIFIEKVCRCITKHCKKGTSGDRS